jgi:hypothetical protein
MRLFKTSDFETGSNITQIISEKQSLFEAFHGYLAARHCTRRRSAASSFR